MPLGEADLKILENLDDDPHLTDIDKQVLQSLMDADKLDDFEEGFIVRLAQDGAIRKAKEAMQTKKERKQRLDSIKGTNPPYHSVLLDKSILDLLGDKDVVIEDAAHALKSIALVGVLLPDTDLVAHGGCHVQDLLGDDRDMIVSVAKNFSKAGIPINPKAKFHIYNLLPPVSSDFLASAHPCAADMNLEFPNADLIMISYIPSKYGARPGSYDYNISRGFEVLNAATITDFRNCGLYTSVSALNHDPGSWSEASFALGAHFVATRGSSDEEVSTEQFKDHENATTLICSEGNEARGLSGNRNIAYVARTDTLPDYADHATDQNQLGQAIQNALN